MRSTLKSISILLIAILFLAVFLLCLQKIIWAIYPANTKIISQPEQLLAAKQQLEYDLVKLDQKLAAKIPRSYYLVINTAANEFSLYKGTELIRQDKCSTGSYILLKNGDEQEWMFKTPKGEFRIQSKTTSPVWKKPDWAFIEEGLPVPSANHSSRFEYGVLGDYALSLGHGYLIHGTLFQRFLGLPVTHGCIRLNDDNLELIYNSLSIGAKVFIY
jgi:L,D-transpeptidase YbiS